MTPHYLVMCQLSLETAGQSLHCWPGRALSADLSTITSRLLRNFCSALSILSNFIIWTSH